MPHCHTYLSRLRENGYRITPQREMIIQIIAHSSRHMTAEEILSQLRKSTNTINIATVYRTLDLLVENGLASRLDIGHGRSAYATSEHGPHLHLVCRHCGRVAEIEESAIEPLVSFIHESYGFDGRPYHFSIHGLCGDCRREDRPAQD